MTTFAVEANTKESPFTISAAESAAGGNTPPIFVTRSQLYYWSAKWQSSERESLADLREGRFQTFPTGLSAAQHLIEDDPGDDVAEE